ncbi:hypothetical protein LA345_00830 [Burkholderia vietnamiensis]|uniref:Uncharacterized protein n=1 Tax=Burkholderia vietnamiensis (strain G4 / LMG 22486) TaxID=269482 RepID=A4JMG9_BURVG|nr:hypothetical protein Bcep1808_4508 [Burkholderia vietnamiensis G4]MCB4342476.1 hypothetical protein [Burkholderia vietnamiensis]
MALTPEKREVLKLARERIENRKNYFLCHALRDAAFFHPHLKEAARELRSFVNEQVRAERSKFAPTLDRWQRRNGFAPRSIAQIRRDRLAWIDWMLDDGEGDPETPESWIARNDADNPRTQEA